MFKRYLHEPLVHFLLLGALTFLLYAFVSSDTNNDDRNVIISKAQVQQLIYRWEKKNFRSPSTQEREEILDKAIYNEVMYREALNMGLDKNDLIIKRRLAQKLEFISSDLVEPRKPTKDELLVYLQQHQNAFILPATISFRIKENIMLPKENSDLTQFEVSRVFGKKFTHALFQLQEKRWLNIDSAYGPLSIYVGTKTEEKLPPFESIEKQLTATWMAQQKEQNSHLYYENLKNSYNVIIED